MLRVRRGKLPLLALAVGATLPTLGYAQTSNWTYNAGGAVPWSQSWNVNTNWNPNTAFPNSTTAVVNLTADRITGGSGTIILNAAPITIGKLAVNPIGVVGPTLDNSYTLTGTGSLTIVGGGTIDVTSSGTASLGVSTINLRLQTPANSNINKVGTGAVVLSGTNSFGGGSGVNGLTVAQGTVVALSPGALTGLGIVSTANDGQLELRNQTVGTVPVPVIAGVGATVAPANGSIYASIGNNTWNGNIFALQNASVGVGSGASLTVNGNVFDAAGTVGNGLTKVGAGVLNVTNLALNGTLTLNSGVTRIKAGGGNAGTSVVRNVVIPGGATPAATLDVNDHVLVIKNGNAGSISALLKSGLENGGNFDWQGPGLNSTSSFTKNNLAGSVLYGLGVLLNSDAPFGGAGDPIYTSLGGVTLTGNEILVKHTYMGDTDLSGGIDSTDYALTDNGFLNNLSGWVNGDFDYNGLVDSTDYALIDNAFLNQGAPLAVSMVSLHTEMFGADYTNALAAVQAGLVPEPGTLGLLGLGAMALMGKRRRK